MIVLLFVLGILCMAYFIGISLYAGWSISFGVFWVVLAFVFFAASVLLKYHKTHPFHIPAKISVTFFVILGILGLIFAVVEGRIIYYANTVPEKKAEYIIVLGAKVHGENVSLSLKKRLDQAYEYARDNEMAKIIVSGGQGEGEAITEAEAMFRYLVKKGINADRIIKEEHSTNTNQNIQFSKQLINTENPKVVVVTNGYHVLRSIRICEKNGLTNVSGLGAATPLGLHVNSYVREAVAYIKDYLIGNI